jgi:prepilin-type processing-associated H-X9-DG protein
VSISVTCECGRHFETPEANAGRRARCPGCGREFTVPEPAPAPQVERIAWEPKPAVTSDKAVASLALGALFFFACLSGVPAILLGRRALIDIDRSGGKLRGRGMAITGIVLGVIGCLFTAALLLPAASSCGEAMRRAACVNNLKQIGLALQYYHEANGSLPPAASTDRDGRTRLSWRVAILPYFDVSTLYLKFHLDEPWDSPHNLTLLEQMPYVPYGCPSDSTRKPGMTGYQVVVGPATAFTPDFKPLTFQDFTDGLSGTVLIGESRHVVPWTKPEDLPFDTALPPDGLGSHHGYHNNGFNAVFADGSVRFLKRSIAPSVLRALLTRSGNEGVSPNSF